MTNIYTDEEIIKGLIRGNKEIVKYFFFQHCASMLRYIAHSVFNGKVEQDELINELYLFLQANDWHKLKQFDYRSKLTTWLNVVAVRYFIKNRELLIEKCGDNDSKQKEQGYSTEEVLIAGMDVKTILAMIPNERYREVIRLLVLEEHVPQEVADAWDITVDNLYNIKRRALKQLEQIIETL